MFQCVWSVGAAAVPGEAYGADTDVRETRVPCDQIAEARTWTIPFPATPEHLEQGKARFLMGRPSVSPVTDEMARAWGTFRVLSEICHRILWTRRGSGYGPTANCSGS